MNFNQKLASVFSLIAIVCQFDIQADDAQMRNLESRLSALEARRSPCMVNPAARPTQKCDWGGYLVLEPLFLKAQESGLEFVTVTQNGPLLSTTPGGVSSTAMQGRSKGKSVNFDWNWGFRIGLGSNLPHDGWDILLDWTHLYTKADKNVSANPLTEVLLPAFLHPQNGGNFVGSKGIFQSQSGAALNAKSNWRLRFNEIDLQLGREFFVSKWLTLKPHAGLRTAWIRQKDFVNYSGFIVPAVVAGSNEVFSSANVFMQSNFWGLGIVGGLDTQWGIACGWSIYANFAASILYGYFDVNHNENANVGSPLPTANLLGFAVGQTVNFFQYHKFYHVGRFIADFGIGLSYDYMFCDERYHLGADIGWEQHLFFAQNQFTIFNSDNEQGQSFTPDTDLYVQGLSVKVRFDF